nr:tetratricopeptide repeat protein [Paracoccus sp. S-4012]
MPAGADERPVPRPGLAQAAPEGEAPAAEPGAEPAASPEDAPAETPHDLAPPAAAIERPAREPVHGPLTRGLAGPYLAARQAAGENDFAAAADYFLRVLQQDSQEPFLIDSALVSLVSAGNVDRAVSLARTLDESGTETELADVVLRAAASQEGDWEELRERSTATRERGTTPGGRLLDGLLEAWALLGAGQATDAMARLEQLARISGAKPMIDYNLALVRAGVGDYEGAEELLAQPDTGLHLPGTIAHAEILVQLDRRDEALALIEDVPGAAEEPALIDLSARLASGQPVPFTALRDAKDGVAQTFLTFATALAASEDPDPLALVQARLAAWLNPQLSEARLVAAQLLQMDGQFDLAEAEYEALRNLGEVRPLAELARIDALARADRLDDAEKAAAALTAAWPQLASAWIASGDILRQREKYTAAIPAYSRALELIAAEDGDARWFPLYARGMARERSGDFDGAERDMRAALDIRPEHPQILNYLGYSLIDRNMHLEEGLEMVEQAARLRPDDGYILDSLGWGLYRLGRFDEAVGPMERAVQTMSNDPLVNDHLGDVYWMAGRQREAETQWQRALSLVLDDHPDETDEEVDVDRIRAKLERGLDAVLEDEAAGRPIKAPAEAAAAPDSADERNGG